MRFTPRGYFASCNTTQLIAEHHGVRFPWDGIAPVTRSSGDIKPLVTRAWVGVEVALVYLRPDWV